MILKQGNNENRLVEAMREGILDNLPFQLQASLSKIKIPAINQFSEPKQ